MTYFIYFVAFVCAAAGYASAFSSGQLPFCAIHNAFQEFGGAPYSNANHMKWVRGPEYCTVDGTKNPMPPSPPFYKFWIGSTPTPETEYIPDEWTQVNLEVLDLTKKYIGLVLYATLAGTNTKTGEWRIPGSDAYYTPASCQNKAVTHKNANIKPMFSKFYMKIPKSTGPIDLWILIKQGEQAKGTFYFPVETNNGKLPNIAESQTVQPPVEVFLSDPSETCNQECFKHNATGYGAFNEASTDLIDVNNLASYMRRQEPCPEPILKGCGAVSPAKGEGNQGYCYYRSTTCVAPGNPGGQQRNAGSDYSTNSYDSKRVCFCGPGEPTWDEPLPGQDPPVTSHLTFPTTLDPGFILNAVDIRDEGSGMRVIIEVSFWDEGWWAIGFGNTFMDTTYAITYATPAIGQLPPLSISGVSYDNLKPHGWYDAQCQGATNDFCFWTQGGGSFWSCLEAGGNGTPTTVGAYYEATTSKVACLNGPGLGTPVPPNRILEHRVLGNHNPGELKPSNLGNLQVIGQTSACGRTTLRIQRDAIVGAGGVYDFDIEAAEHTIIWAYGATNSFPSKHDTAVQTLSPTKLSMTHVNVTGTPVYTFLGRGPGYNGNPCPPPPFMYNAASSAHPSSGILLTAMVCLVQLLSRGRTTLLVIVLSVVLLCGSVEAHNWVNTASRATEASVAKPCLGRSNKNPHVQVQAGQLFLYQWATGHGNLGGTEHYVAIFHEDDLWRATEMGQGDLESYFNNAPPGSPTMDLVDSPRQKFHFSPGPRPEFGAEITGGSLYIQVEAIYTAKTKRFQDNLKQFWYPPSKKQNDRYAEYVSPNPLLNYIEAAWRFHNDFHQPIEVDGFLAHVPARKGVGNYIAFYLWAGYRDCTDVHVQSMTVPVQYKFGNPAITPTDTFIKIDHCEIRYIHELEDICRVAPKISGGSDVSQCLADCLAKPRTSFYNPGCTYVAAVRKTNPVPSDFVNGVNPGVMSYPINIPNLRWLQWQGWPKHHSCYGGSFGTYDPPEECWCEWSSQQVRELKGCDQVESMCDSAPVNNAAADDFICYSLHPFSNDDNAVEEVYETANDPRDPKFYNTCWVKTQEGGFLPHPPVPSVITPPWRLDSGLQQNCLDCAWLSALMANPNVEHLAPDWTQGVRHECENCDVPSATSATGP